MNWLKRRLSTGGGKLRSKGINDGEKLALSAGFKRIASLPNLKESDRMAVQLLNDTVESELRSLRRLLAASKLGGILETLNRRAVQNAFAKWRNQTARMTPKVRSRSIISLSSYSAKKGYMYIGCNKSPLNDAKMSDDGRRRSLRSLHHTMEIQKRTIAHPLKRTESRNRLSKGNLIETPWGTGKVRSLNPNSRIVQIKLKFGRAFVHAKWLRPSTGTAYKFTWSNSNKTSKVESTEEGNEHEFVISRESHTLPEASYPVSSLKEPYAPDKSSYDPKSSQMDFKKKKYIAKDVSKEPNKPAPLKEEVKTKVDATEILTKKQGIQRRLIDYIITYRVETKNNDSELSANLITTERKAHRKDIDRALANIPGLSHFMSSRFPPVDHSDFELKEHLGSAFAFLEGVRLSRFRRMPHIYHSVVTREDGTRLYATYLTLDEPDPVVVKLNHYQYLMAHGAMSPSHTDPSSASSRFGMTPPSRHRKRYTTLFTSSLQTLDSGSNQRTRSHTVIPSTTVTQPSSSQQSGASSPRRLSQQPSQDSHSQASINVSGPYLLHNPLSQVPGSPSQVLDDLYQEGAPKEFYDESEDFLPLGELEVQAYKPMCVCILSHYPKLLLFADIIKALLMLHHDAIRLFDDDDDDEEENQSKRNESIVHHVPLERWIIHIVSEIPLPIPGHTRVQFEIAGRRMACQLPGVRSPLESTIPMLNLFRLLPIRDILMLMAAVLTERRLLFHSNSLTRIVYSTQCLLQLMYPFQWWYTYIPTLAEYMLDAVEMPGPYILGTRTHNLQYIDEDSLTNTMIVDLDTKEIVSSNPLPVLPEKPRQDLESDLRKAISEAVMNEDLCTAESLSLRSKSMLHLSTFATGKKRSNVLGKGKIKRDFEEYDGDCVMDAFDLKISRAILRFYSKMMSGFRRFVYFVNKVPFFNAQGFVDLRAHEKCAGVSDADFYKEFAYSRAFEVFLEDEAEPDEYHDLLSLGTDSRRLLENECGIKEVYNINYPGKAPFPENVNGAGTFTSTQEWCEHVWQNSIGAYHTKMPVELDALKWLTYEKASKVLRRTSFARLNSLGPLERASSLSKIGKEKNLKDPAIASAIIRAAVISILSGKDISKVEMKRIRRSLEQPKARTMFSRMLQGGEGSKRSGAGSNSVQCLTDSGFKSLCEISKSFLDCCGKQKDYRRGLALMRVTNVFYMQQKGNTMRKFLGDVIQKNKFWKNLSFWRASLKAAVLKKALKNRRDREYHTFIQGWLVENLHKMLMFNVDLADIKDFVEEVKQKHNLPLSTQREVDAFAVKMEAMYAALKQLSKP